MGVEADPRDAAPWVGTEKCATVCLALMSLAGLLCAQDAMYPPPKPSPAKIEAQIFVFPEAVAQAQWTHTLKLVNAPQDISLLNPGQCVRVGIFSTGDNRDDYLEKTRLSFQVRFAGRTDALSPAAISVLKQIKPEGEDFAVAVLNSAGVRYPDKLKTAASLGVSAEHWCAPADAADGTATLEAEVQSPGGHQILKPSVIEIESFDTGSKKSFKDARELGPFLQAYYRQPNPARLLPALQFLVADATRDPKHAKVEIVSAFLSAAIKSDPGAAQDFLKRIAVEPPLTRALGLLIVRSAGYDISPVLNAMSVEDRQKFLTLTPLQDPFDLSPTQDLFQHLDMLWAVFGATGEFGPVKTIAGALNWRGDYEDFQKLINTTNHPKTLTPSIARGVTYAAAGWSLSSFQRADPLVADYIEYLLASPDTPQAEKSELAALSSNPAFKKPGGK